MRGSNGLPNLVRKHRRAILLIAALLTAASVWALRLLRADPSPRALLASADLEQGAVSERFRAYFGSTDNVIAVILETPRTVFTPEALGYMYALGEAARELPHVERIDSLARTPFRQAVQEDTLSLDDLEDAAPSNPTADDPDLLGAMSDVVAAAPEIFPMGLASLSERMGGPATIAPLIDSATPTAEQVAALEEAYLATPLLRGRLVSRDGRSALVAVALTDSLDEHRELARVVEGLQNWLDAHPAPEGVAVYVAGLPVVRTTMVDHMRRDQMVLTPGTLVVSLFLLMLAFRWWAGVALPLAKVALTSLWVLGGMALFGVKLNVVTNILPALLIILGLSDSIHLMSRYLQEYTARRDAQGSLDTAVHAISRASLGTSSTTAAGLFALYVSKTQMLAEFGVVGGVGVMLGYLTTILFLPAMLQGLMPRLKPLKAGVRVARSPLNRLVTQLTIGILRRPRTVLLASLVVTVAALWTGSKVRVDSALLDQFRPDDPIYQTTRLLETQFEGVRPFEVMLSSDQPKRFLQPEVLKAVARVSAWASKQPGVLTVMDATDPLSRAWAGLTGGAASAEDALRTEGQLEGLRYVLNKQKPSPIAGFLSDDAQHTRIRIRLTDLGSRATLAFTDALKAELSRELGHFKDIKVAFTGDAYVSSRGLDAVVSDLTGSLGVAVTVILVIIVLVFRSVRYGLLSIPPNVVPLAFALAWMVLRDIPLNAATAIIFSVSIGVAVDGSIHVLSRLREELRRYPGLNGAVLRTARGTGRALVVSCSSLVLGFSVLLLSSFVPVQRFAELIAVSIASCLVATLVILPAVVQLAGPRFLRE